MTAPANPPVAVEVPAQGQASPQPSSQRDRMHKRMKPVQSNPGEGPLGDVVRVLAAACLLVIAASTPWMGFAAAGPASEPASRAATHLHR